MAHAVCCSVTCSNPVCVVLVVGGASLQVHEAEQSVNQSAAAVDTIRCVQWDGIGYMAALLIMSAVREAGTVLDCALREAGPEECTAANGMAQCSSRSEWVWHSLIVLVPVSTTHC
jgi:hypothetical protein